MQAELEEILAAFDAAGWKAARLGRGNINETFLVTAGEGKSGRFVLQRISSAVFPEPGKVIDNFKTIEEHFARRHCNLPFPISLARVVTTREGHLFHCDRNGNYWRAQTYLENFKPAVVDSRDSASRLGSALATFHHMSRDLEPSRLHDPLPGFHDLENYLRQYEAAKTTFIQQRHDEKSDFCVRMLDRNRASVERFLRTAEDDQVPHLITHGDPKCDNFLFGQGSREVAIIDLDTVGSGLLSYDLGDCLRSLGNRAGEEGGEKAADIDPDLCTAFARGYAVISDVSPELLSEFFFGGLLTVTYELALRFFTDHLQGDRYFRVQHRGQNLDRAVGQFRLLKAIIGRERAMRSLLG